MITDLKVTKGTIAQESHDSGLDRLSVAHILFGIVIILTALMRFYQLDGTPLSPNEAQESLSIWNFWKPDPGPIDPVSPAYFTLSLFLTQLIGFSDTVMRLIPAIFATCMAVAPWLLRHRLGYIGTLITSLLIAVSPIYSIVGRTAGGNSIALFSIMLLFAAIVRYRDSLEQRWLNISMFALGLGLATTPIFYSALLLMVLSWFLLRVLGSSLESLPNANPSLLPGVGRRSLLKGLWVLIPTFLLVSTAALVNLRGLGSAITIFPSWLALFTKPVTLEMWFSPILALARYEIALLLIGLPAAVWASLKNERFLSYIVYWLVGAILLSLIQRGFVDNALVLVLPGYMLIGRVINDSWKGRLRLLSIGITLSVIIAGAMIYANLIRFIRLILYQDAAAVSQYGLLALLVLILIIFSMILLWGWDRRSVKQGAVLGFLVVLLVYSWGTGFWLTNYAGNDTRERWISEATDNDTLLLVEMIQEISFKYAHSENGLSIISSVDTPPLRWYMRDFTDLTIGSPLPRATESAALITENIDYPVLERDYIGVDFAHLRPETTHSLGTEEALRWWLLRESFVPVNQDRIILWIRADLPGGPA